jgi:hypothetical protein
MMFNRANIRPAGGTYIWAQYPGDSQRQVRVQINGPS